jgi:hypothetical protein
LDEGAGAAVLERRFEVLDGVYLAGAETGGVERGEGLEAIAEGVWRCEPFGEGFRAVEGEEFAGAGLGVALIGEAGDDAGGFVDEGEGLGIVDPLELGGGVVAGLLFDGGDVVAPFRGFGFDDGGGLFVDEEDVIGWALVGLVFADGDFGSRGPCYFPRMQLAALCPAS